MKNIFLFLLLGGLVSFSACSKSDNTPSIQETLVGTWNVTSLLDLDGDEMIDQTTPGYTSSGVFTFTADGKATLVLTYVELATNTTDTDSIEGTYAWENDNTLVIIFPPEAPDAEAAVLRGIPAIQADQLSATFEATTADGNGVIVLQATKL